MNAVVFAFAITAPNLLLMALGFYMQRKALVNDDFVKVATHIVFQYCLPCLLFFSVVRSDVDYAAQSALLAAGFVCTFALFFLASAYAHFFAPDPKDKGVFVQGVFRSNMAIMSLALVANAYGEEGIGVGALYMGVLTIAYNVLAVIALSGASAQNASAAKRCADAFKKIATNPLIVALVAAFVYKGLGLADLAQFIQKTADLLAAMALPLALICAGATLDVKSMLKPTGLSMQASLGRMVVAPLLATIVGRLFGLAPLQMGVLFLMVASPAAAASYVMAKAMGGNAALAANILAFTTAFGLVTLAVGMAILRALGWV